MISKNERTDVDMGVIDMLESDEKFMKLALSLAEKGRGYVNPNPLVGAVIVKDGKVIGEGYHTAFGKSHAEIEAINSATEDIKSATMYVTLEPCCHQGKTPPCTEAIIKNQLARVVVATTDPNPLVSGSGIEKLKQSNIEITVGVLEEMAKIQNEVFIHYMTTNLPFTILKYAMSLDGKIACHTGDSKWITSEKSRTDVHRLRSSVSAVVTGIGTILSDDASLNVRLIDSKGREPHRIVVDSAARISLDAKIINLDSKSDTYIAVTEAASDGKLRKLEDYGAKIIMTKSKDGKVDLEELWKELGFLGMDSILIEAGEQLSAALLEAKLVNKIRAYIAPKIIGGTNAKSPIGGYGASSMSEVINLKSMNFTHIENDFVVEGYIK
ncbi:fused diaminohydroxyphosphoribosylaminopyrimidine deaminase; 5-amino-6-(5-phosphoribosylamino) uracil reductase [Acetoanaerobium sticklandii]|uniref:Riboflavin biosynthesis protein RibD n=1 Tax=Acetoanaerobium sticklandii (strain ATCC 12662 / DSM 519 / JCM 1433 / CCUG 9281 / NCIMB 10654 / HF) TaxID=499177 RepID=E3PVH3_ACESD|nr:bifunctional diaminohydroxyphosphoribosylaminopyrimidine deaminase/5-amino-6-(5-phosphoribosylamino)uracil reductase RibD [Acetoanaerobium sticklandii]CBH20540.1 fused diaminohydroxyphosphoribosylaminopyrimidine deaminase; 5-amino-6-(5-phosphoribosylamino) uracil reductase [Acetoanaerobium sticklandii]